MRASAAFLIVVMAIACRPIQSPAEEPPPAGALKLHAIFASNMVLQRDKPIKVWGWARPGQAVSVQLGAVKG